MSHPTIRPTAAASRARLSLSAIALGAAFALGGCAATAPAAPKLGAAATPKTALWVGNSFFYYNNSMHGHVGRMLAAAKPGEKGFRATSATISGSGMNWHDVGAHFRPNAVGSYSFDSQNNVVFNTFDKPFDVAILMDCSQCPVHPQLAPLFHEYAAKHSATVRKHGAEPVFFMSWAYADKPEMTQQLADAYVKAATVNKAKVVPAGLAFANSIAKRPDINLYVADKRHPSLEGTYLAAATVLASVYGVSPVGNSYTAGLRPEVAAHLQLAAADTVKGFQQPN